MTTSELILTLVIIWMVLGIIGWSWANYNFHAINPDNDEDSVVKWYSLCACMIIGPLSFLAVCISVSHYGKLRVGLRFK